MSRCENIFLEFPATIIKGSVVIVLIVYGSHLLNMSLTLLLRSYKNIAGISKRTISACKQTRVSMRTFTCKDRDC
jgi:hypothetical protein